MDDKYILTVIIPSYNNDQYIERCLKSIINQSIKNIKIIIILTNENKKEYDNLISIGVKKIFYNNKVEIKEILDIINEENDTDKLIEEINSLKKIILENKNINNIQNKEIIKEENKKCCEKTNKKSACKIRRFQRKNR